VQRREVAAALTAQDRHGRHLRKLRAEALGGFGAKPRCGQHKLSKKQVRLLKSQLAKALLMQQLRLLPKPTSTDIVFRAFAKPSKQWQGPQHRSASQITKGKVRQAVDSTAASDRAQRVMQRLVMGLELLAAAASTDVNSTDSDSTDTDISDADIAPDAAPAQQQRAQQPQWKVALDISYDAFMARAASPGVLLQVLQHHVHWLSAAQCSLAYLRLSQLCKARPTRDLQPPTCTGGPCGSRLVEIQIPSLPGSLKQQRQCPCARLYML
jgi:hypothetical protein